jgi:hypothetical protein
MQRYGGVMSSSNGSQSGENVSVCGMDGVSVYGEGGESIAAQHNAPQHNTPYYLSHHIPSLHTTPDLDKFLSPTMPGYVKCKAIVLLPVDGRLIPCGLVDVVVKGD